MHLAFSLSPEKAKLWRELFGTPKTGQRAFATRDSSSQQGCKWYWVMRRPGLRPDLMEAANLDSKTYLCLEHSTLFTEIDFVCSTEFLLVVPHDRISAHLSKHSSLYANFELITRPSVSLKIEFTKSDARSEGLGNQAVPVVATCVEPVSYKKGPVEGFVQLTELIEEMLRNYFLMGGQEEEEQAEQPRNRAAPSHAGEEERPRTRGDSSNTDISGLTEDSALAAPASRQTRQEDIYICPRNALVSRVFDTFAAIGPEHITLSLRRVAFSDGQVVKKLKTLSSTTSITITYPPVQIEAPKEDDQGRLDPASLYLLAGSKAQSRPPGEKEVRSIASISAYVPSKTLASVYRQASSVASALGLGWSLIMSVSEKVVVFAVLTKGGEEFYQICCEVVVHPGV